MCVLLLIGAATLAAAVTAREEGQFLRQRNCPFRRFEVDAGLLRNGDLAAVAGDPNAEGAPFVVRLVR